MNLAKITIGLLVTLAVPGCVAVDDLETAYSDERGSIRIERCLEVTPRGILDHMHCQHRGLAVGSETAIVDFRISGVTDEFAATKFQLAQQLRLERWSGVSWKQVSMPAFKVGTICEASTAGDCPADFCSLDSEKGCVSDEETPFTQFTFTLFTAVNIKDVDGVVPLEPGTLYRLTRELDGASSPGLQGPRDFALSDWPAETRFCAFGEPCPANFNPWSDQVLTDGVAGTLQVRLPAVDKKSVAVAGLLGKSWATLQPPGATEHIHPTSQTVEADGASASVLVELEIAATDGLSSRYSLPALRVGGSPDGKLWNDCMIEGGLEVQP